MLRLSFGVGALKDALVSCFVSALPGPSVEGLGFLFSNASGGIEVRLIPNVGHGGSQKSKNSMGKLLQIPPSLNQFFCKSVFSCSCGCGPSPGPLIAEALMV